MRDVLDDLIALLGREPVALARVVDATGSGPRETGSAMVVTGGGVVVGSLSGGCLESAVVDTARSVLDSGDAALDRYGDTAGDMVAIGLPCGGEVEILVERVDPARREALVALRRALDAEEPVALVTTLRTRPEWALLSPAQLSPAHSRPWHGIDRDALALLAAGQHGIVGHLDGEPGPDPRPRAFVQVFTAAPRMILAGANDFVRALAHTGRDLGYRVTVVDARETFATPARFPAAHEVVVDWPHRYLDAQARAGRLDARTVICVLTHDAKFDVPALARALALDDVAFVGALGSRRTHADRLARLRDAGITDAALARLHSPIGLDLAARTPQETAVSIAAHILAVRGGASARPLDQLDGPIHR